jgi:hypothetical protein
MPSSHCTQDWFGFSSAGLGVEVGGKSSKKGGRESFDWGSTHAQIRLEALGCIEGPPIITGVCDNSIKGHDAVAERG